MKKVSALFGVFLAITGSCIAQGPYSLQIGETAAPAKEGMASATAGVNFGPHSMYAGARGAFGPMDDLLVFADAGLADVDRWDGGACFQGGGMFTLPIPLPVDIAIRGTIYKPFIDSHVRIWGGTLGGIISRDLESIVPGLSTYGYIGLDLRTTTESVRLWNEPADAPANDVVRTLGGKVNVTDDSLDVAVALGAVFRIDDRISAYGEISHDDDLFIGGGCRMTF